MRECAENALARRCRGIAKSAALVVTVAITTCGCGTATSMVAASAYRKASVYGTATAYVRLAPDDTFERAVQILAEREDIEITALDDVSTRCTAVAGDRALTFRVFESDAGRSRLSMLVGGGDDPVANQKLANQLMQQICGDLEAACE